MLWIENDLGWESNSETFKITVLKSGGRLLSTKINGVEFLEQEAQQVGNTFWTSPQSGWEWPPLKEHDEDDYQGRLDGSVLMLRSSVDSKLNFRIIKEYKLINESTFSVKYGIVNHNDEAKKVAPWEITRVPALGTNENYISAMSDLIINKENYNFDNKIYPPNQRCPNNFQKCPCLNYE